MSVIICAYNPDPDIFKKVITSLQNQSLTFEYWELIIIDNNSTTPISTWLNIDWHPEGRIISEKNPGLINARNKGTVKSKYDYLISVDDDTALFADYLEQAQKIYAADPLLGIIGGRSFPIFIEEPPKWIGEFNNLLAIRDLGEEEIVQQVSTENKSNYPMCSPILIAPRKKCMEDYLIFFKSNDISHHLGRKGDSLASGEDNDINMYIFLSGYKLGYFPNLKFYHIIPAFRTTKNYLCKMAYESNRSWIKMLNNHKINPWKQVSPISVLPRQIKAYFTYKAWISTPNYIKWRGACGMFKGLSEL